MFQLSGFYCSLFEATVFGAVFGSGSVYLPVKRFELFYA